jgi:hypothetical protein
MPHDLGLDDDPPLALPRPGRVARLPEQVRGGAGGLRQHPGAAHQAPARLSRRRLPPIATTYSTLSFAKSPAGPQVVDPSSGCGHYLSSMITILLYLLRLLPFLFGGHRQLALENLALRQQLAVYRRMMTRPRLRRTERLFWVGLARVWSGWRQSLVIVTPDTVLRWQRHRFRKYWSHLSAGSTGGRPPVDAEIKALVARMATVSPLWGAPRIHDEILKLGIDVAERTVVG